MNLNAFPFVVVRGLTLSREQLQHLVAHGARKLLVVDEDALYELLVFSPPRREARVELAEREVPTHGAQNAIELAMHVINQPAPTLTWSTAASPPFRHFIAMSLIKEPQFRPAADELSAHEFVQDTRSVPLAELITRGCARTQ